MGYFKKLKRVSYKEIVTEMSKAMGLKTIILLIIDAVIMTAGAIFCLGLPQSRMVGLAGTIFFGLALIQFIIMFKYAVTK